LLFVGATGFLSQQQLMHVPLHDRYIPLSRTIGYRSRNQCVRVAFLLSKGATVEEVQHAMHVLGVPADVAALSISTAAASVAAAAATGAAFGAGCLLSGLGWPGPGADGIYTVIQS
jgi:hypothetical protein